MRKCTPEDISLKSYFLGPQAENTFFLHSAFMELVSQYCHWRKSLFPADGTAISQEDQRDPLFLRNQNELHLLISNLSKDFQAEIPQFSPRYLGHMFSELSLPGILGHLVALLHNPNNISKESSHVGLRIEGEAIQSLCSIFNWKAGTGHLTSGGTLANLEALLRMRARLPESQWPKMKLLTSAAVHYSWKKNIKIMGLPEASLIEVPLDAKGRMSSQALEKILQTNSDPILGVVSLFGSTERGTLDDIAALNRLFKKYSHKKVWHHVDAAYGGFFACVGTKPGSFLSKQTQALKGVDSLTLDPHKLGYVPYSCGAFLCRDQKKYFYSTVEAPYIQFRSAQEAGVQSIEGSRPATGASATWVTARSLGFHPNGLGKVLERHLKSKIIFQSVLKKSVKNIYFTEGLDLNILCWTVLPSRRSLKQANRRVDQIFEKLPQADSLYYVSKTTLPLAKNPWLEKNLRKAGFQIDTDSCHLIRMTLMNPFLITKESKTPFIRDFTKSLQSILSSL